MELGWVDFAWKVAITVVNAAGWIWMYLSNRDKVTNVRINTLQSNLNGQLTDLKEEVDIKMADHSDRITGLERDIKHSPTHDDLADLHRRISGVASGMDTMSGELVGIKTTLNMIHQYLLNNGGAK